jgi:hypothetical protein
MVISLMFQNKWKIYQMDVKSAFLNKILEEEIYVEQPMGYVIKGDEDKVLKLKKTFLDLNKHQGHGILELITTFKRIVSLNVLKNMLFMLRCVKM